MWIFKELFRGIFLRKKKNLPVPAIFPRELTEYINKKVDELNTKIK